MLTATFKQAQRDRFIHINIIAKDHNTYELEQAENFCKLGCPTSQDLELIRMSFDRSSGMFNSQVVAYQKYIAYNWYKHRLTKSSNPTSVVQSKTETDY